MSKSVEYRILRLLSRIVLTSYGLLCLTFLFRSHTTRTAASVGVGNFSNLKKQYPNAVVIDVTSHATDKFVKLSPFYPHGGIPIKGMSLKGASVEGIWQGLKTFDGEGISRDTILNTTMHNIKRTVRTHGKPKGHLVDGNLLGYLKARKELYVPTYNWVLENKCMDLVKEIASYENVIRLDYNTNEGVEDLSTPLSHASLIKNFIMTLSA